MPKQQEWNLGTMKQIYSAWMLFDKSPEIIELG